VAKTLLVDMLLECEELRRLSDSLPVCKQREDIENKITDCQAILDYLRARFVDLNPRYSKLSSIDVEQTRADLVAMTDLALLRYGTVLKYICAAEASIVDLPLDQCDANFHAAQEEWRRRFGTSVIADSL
jgi:hypothetical protein